MSGSVVVRDDLTPFLRQLKAELDQLARMEIRVGVLASEGGELLKIARVHEYGMTITPKTARNLAIPLKPSCKGKSPRDFARTWILESKGIKYIVRDKGKDEIEFLYMLLPKVTIPERSFIRAGYDAGESALAAKVKECICAVIAGRLTAEQAGHQIGQYGRDMIKRYMRTVTPGKANSTLAASPGKTTPLVQSGRLQDAITYEVVIK